MVLYYAAAYLLVGEEFNARVGEDAEEGCRVAFKEPAYTGADVNVANGGREADPGAGVLCELGVAGLEEDLDAVEGADYCFRLYAVSIRSEQSLCIGRILYIQHILRILLPVHS